MYVPPCLGTVGGRPAPTPSGTGGTSTCTNSQQRGRWSSSQPTFVSSECSWSMRNWRVFPPEPPSPTTQILYTFVSPGDRKSQRLNGSSTGGAVCWATEPDRGPGMPNGSRPAESPRAKGSAPRGALCAKGSAIPEVTGALAAAVGVNGAAPKGSSTSAS